MKAPKPITRKDMYYSYMINGGGPLPEPITREEKYLYYLCANGFGALGGNGGVSDYNFLQGKPQINGVTLQGDLSPEDLEIQEFSGDYQDLQGAPDALPCPFPVTFSGMLQNISYDGSQPVNITFPDMSMTNQSAGTPVGEIISYMGTTAPANYLACDGAEYRIEDYPYLAKHFTDELGSSNYFGGDGETTFAVPDLRGEFLRGTGTASRNTGSGAAVGVHQDGTGHLRVEVGADNIMYVPGKGNHRAFKNNDVTYNLGTMTGRNTNQMGANDTYVGQYEYYTARPTNSAVMFCIKSRPTYFMSTQAIYSYEERPVGIWVDGKTLYEKTINFGSLPNAGTKSIPHNIENAAEIWIHEGHVNDLASGLSLPVSHPHTEYVKNSWNCAVDHTNISFTAGMDRSGFSAVVTVRYTKN